MNGVGLGSCRPTRQVFDTAGIRDVGSNGSRLTAELGAFVDCQIEWSRPTGGNDQPGSMRGESVRGRAPDAARSSGDDDHFALERHSASPDLIWRVWHRYHAKIRLEDLMLLVSLGNKKAE